MTGSAEHVLGQRSYKNLLITRPRPLQQSCTPLQYSIPFHRSTAHRSTCRACAHLYYFTNSVNLRVRAWYERLPTGCKSHASGVALCGDPLRTARSTPSRKSYSRCSKRSEMAIKGAYILAVCTKHKLPALCSGHESCFGRA